MNSEVSSWQCQVVYLQYSYKKKKDTSSLPEVSVRCVLVVLVYLTYPTPDYAAKRCLEGFLGIFLSIFLRYFLRIFLNLYFPKPSKICNKPLPRRHSGVSRLRAILSFLKYGMTVLHCLYPRCRNFLRSNNTLDLAGAIASFLSCRQPRG